MNSARKELTAALRTTRYFSSQNTKGANPEGPDIEICRAISLCVQGTVATNWDLSGLAVPLLYLNAIGGDAGGHKYITHGS
ncbi:hypothetical protein TNIN_260981 [Trichonephila inaurata madagascariensis]|uniref:Uncharacterized protein n=1 Tax=Trichonephila inaurata madagascariensis TaxID=2747483 RepID=A0A8X7C9R5_9ARAC|nr:hypothetical protein TNIN_260981 [Trichonephila inaurata madagascariensis]